MLTQISVSHIALSLHIIILTEWNSAYQTMLLLLLLCNLINDRSVFIGSRFLSLSLWFSYFFCVYFLFLLSHCLISNLSSILSHVLSLFHFSITLTYTRQPRLITSVASPALTRIWCEYEIYHFPRDFKHFTIELKVS